MSKRLSFDEISAIMASRRQSDSPLLSRMADIASRFNGNVTIALPDVAGEPVMPLPIPNLIADAIDQNSLRAASTSPLIHCPALKPRDAASVKRAATRRRALYAAWDYSGLLETLLPRSYRHLTGYGTNCFVVVPDYDANRSRIEIRDPLSAYPEHRSSEDTRQPLNVGFVFGRSLAWILHHYPESAAHFDNLRTNLRHNQRALATFNDSLWDLVEWIDEDQIVIGVLGPRDQIDLGGGVTSVAGGMGLHLRTWENRAGMVTASVPRRMTLDQIDGQVSKLTGLVDMMGRLMALDVQAADKAIFPDFVIIDDTGTPQLLNASGQWNDGRSGEANLVKAKSIQLLNSSPGPLTHPVIDRLERNYRHSAGMPGILGGENTNSLRTGNALDSMSAMSVDPRIQELQRLMTRSLKVVNEAVCNVETGYFGNRKQVFFSGWPGDRGHVEYTPNRDFDSHENAVSYAFPGTDINGLTVALGQAVREGLISKKTARSKHPLVDDAEANEEQIFAETLESAAMQSVMQQAAAGALPLIDLVEIFESMYGPTEWTKAVRKSQQIAQDRQATPAAPEDPLSQPGLSMPGMGVESVVDPAASPGGGGLDFSSLISALSAQPSPAA